MSEFEPNEEYEFDFVKFDEQGEPYTGLNIGQETVILKRDNTKIYVHPEIYEGVDNIKVQTLAKSLGQLVLFRQAFGQPEVNVFDQFTMELAMVDFDSEFRHVPTKQDLDHLWTLNLSNEDVDDLEDSHLDEFIIESLKKFGDDSPPSVA